MARERAVLSGADSVENDTVARASRTDAKSEKRR